MNLVPSPLQKVTSSLERSFRVGGLAADAPNRQTGYVPAVRETVALIGNSAWARIPMPIRRRKRFVRELGIVSVAYVAYFGARGLTVGDLNDALSNAAVIIDVERALGLFVEPTIQGALVGYDWTLKLASWL